MTTYPDRVSTYRGLTKPEALSLCEIVFVSALRVQDNGPYPT